MKLNIEDFRIDHIGGDDYVIHYKEKDKDEWDEIHQYYWDEHLQKVIDNPYKYKLECYNNEDFFSWQFKLIRKRDK